MYDKRPDTFPKDRGTCKHNGKRLDTNPNRWTCYHVIICADCGKTLNIIDSSD